MEKWNFPSNNFGTVTGIGEAGIETFNGSPYVSLTREICQNSMDARMDESKPVIVEFSSFEMGCKSIPDYNGLNNAVRSCLDFWTENHNKKTIDFFNKAVSVMNRDRVMVLRVSDFNTTGLTGSDKEYNTPWQNLVKAAGVSDKGGSAGGSYGIGKSAQFACSDLRTLFYTTVDVDGLEASQGIARLVSFREKSLFGKEKDSITTGIGYYSNDKKNSAIRKCISLQQGYERNVPGTDIYIIGFKKIPTWKDEVITAVLEDFLIALYNRELIVHIDDIEISADTIDSMIEKYKGSAKKAVNYYKVLTEPNTVVINHEFPKLGTIELRVLISSGLHRCVMMCRRNGMKIFDQNRISASIQFAGVCILKDKNINAYFREMENPQHDKWEPYRHNTDSETKAKKNKTMLSKFIKDSVIEQGKKTTVDEVDAEGVGEFIADIDYADTNNQKKEESVSSETKNIEISISLPRSCQKGFEHSLNSVYEATDTQFGEQTEQAFGDTGSKDFGSNRNVNAKGNGFGGGYGDGFGTNGLGNNPYMKGVGSLQFDNPVKTTVEVKIMSVRLFLSDKTKNEYTLVFTPTKDLVGGYLQFFFDGEKNTTRKNDRIPVPISSAIDKNTENVLSCVGNKIQIGDVTARKKGKVKFVIDYDDECAMEVNLYGYPS